MNPSPSFTSPLSSNKKYINPKPTKSDLDDSNPVVSPSAPIRKSVQYRATPESVIISSLFKSVQLGRTFTSYTNSETVSKYYNLNQIWKLKINPSHISQDKEQDQRVTKASKIQIGSLRQKISILKKDKKFMDDRNAIKSNHEKLMQSGSNMQEKQQSKDEVVVSPLPQKSINFQKKSPSSNNKPTHIPIFIQAYTPKAQQNSPDIVNSSIRSHSQQQPTTNPPHPTQISNPPTLPNSNNRTPLTQRIKQSSSKISPAGTANSQDNANQLLLSFALSATTINSNNTNMMNNYNSNNSQQVIGESPFKQWQSQQYQSNNFQSGGNNILSSQGMPINSQDIPIRVLSRFDQEYSQTNRGNNQFYSNYDQRRSNLISAPDHTRQTGIMSENNILQFNNGCMTITQKSQQRTQNAGGIFLRTVRSFEKDDVADQEQKIVSGRLTKYSLDDASSLTQRVYSKKLPAKQLAESQHGAASQDGSASYIASSSHTRNHQTNQNQNNNIATRPNLNGSDSQSRGNFPIQSVICSPKERSQSGDSQIKKIKEDQQEHEERKTMKRNMSLDDVTKSKYQKPPVKIIKRQSIVLDKSRSRTPFSSSSNIIGDDKKNDGDVKDEKDNIYRSIGRLDKNLQNSTCNRDKKFEFELSSQQDESPRIQELQKTTTQNRSKSANKSQFKINNYNSDDQLNSDEVDLTLTPFLIVDCSQFDSIDNTKQNQMQIDDNLKNYQLAENKQSLSPKLAPNCILSDSVFKSNSSQDFKQQIEMQQESPFLQEQKKPIIGNSIPVQQLNSNARNSRRDTLVTLGPQGHCFVAAGNNNSGRTISPNQSMKSYNPPGSILFFKTDCENNDSEYVPMISDQQDNASQIQSLQKLPQFKKCTQQTLYLGNDEYQDLKQQKQPDKISTIQATKKQEPPCSSPSSIYSKSQSKSDQKMKKGTSQSNISIIEEESKSANNISEWQPITLMSDQSNNTKFSFSRSPLFQALQTPSPLSKYPNPLNITEYPPSSKSGGGYDIVEYLINQGTPPGKKLRKKGDIPPTVPQKVAKNYENPKSEDSSSPTPKNINNLTSQNQSISGFSGLNPGVSSNDNAIESGLYTFTNTFGLSFSNSKLSEKKVKDDCKEDFAQIDSQNLKSPNINPQLAQLKQNLRNISKNKNERSRGNDYYDQGLVQLGMRCSSAPPQIYSNQGTFTNKSQQFDFKTKVISQMKKYILFLKQQLQASRLFQYTLSNNNNNKASSHHRRLSSFDNMFMQNQLHPYISNTTFHSKHSQEIPIQLTPPPNKPNELNGRITALHTAQQDHCQDVYDNPSSLIYASTFVDKDNLNQISQNSSNILQSSKPIKPHKQSPLLIPTPTTKRWNKFKNLEGPAEFAFAEDNNKSLGSTFLHASASTPKLLTTSQVIKLHGQNPFTDKKSRQQNDSQTNQCILNNTVSLHQRRSRSASTPVVNSGNLKIHLQNLKCRITQIKKERDSFLRILTQTKKDLKFERQRREEQKRKDQSKRTELASKLNELTNELKLSMEAQQELSRQLRHHQTRPPVAPHKIQQSLTNYISDNEYKKVMEMVHQLDNRCAEQEIKISNLLQQMRQAEQDADRARTDHCRLFQKHDQTLKQMQKLKSEKEKVQIQLFEKEQDFISMKSALDIEQRLKVINFYCQNLLSYQNMIQDQKSQTASLSFSTSAKKVSGSNGPQPRQRDNRSSKLKQHRRGSSNASSKNIQAMIMQINSHPDSLEKKEQTGIIYKSGGSSSSFVDQDCKQKSVKRVLNLDDQVNPASDGTSQSQIREDEDKSKTNKRKKERYFDDDEEEEQDFGEQVEKKIEQFRFQVDEEGLYVQNESPSQKHMLSKEQSKQQHKHQDSLSQEVALYLSSQQRQEKSKGTKGESKVPAIKNHVFGQQILPVDALSGRSSQICRQQSSDIFQLSTSQKKKLNLIASYGGGSSLLGSGNKIQSGGGTIIGSALASLRVSQTTINCQTDKKLDNPQALPNIVLQCSNKAQKEEAQAILPQTIAQKQPSFIQQESKQLYTCTLQFNDGLVAGGGGDTTRGSPHSRQIIKQLNFDETPQQRSLLSTSNFVSSSNRATKFENSTVQKNNINTRNGQEDQSILKKESYNNNINPLLQIQDEDQQSMEERGQKQNSQQIIKSNNQFMDPIQMPKSLNSTMQYKSQFVSVVDDDQKKEVEELIVATDGKNSQQHSEFDKKDVLPNFCAQVNALLAQQQREIEQIKEDTADIARIHPQNSSRPASKAEGNMIPIQEYKDISQKFHQAEYQRGKLIKILQMLGINQDSNQQINRLIELKQNDNKIQRTKQDMRKKYSSLKKQMVKQAKRWQMVSQRQDKIEKREMKLNDREKSCIEREGLLQMRIVCVKEMEQLVAAKNAKSQLIKEKKQLQKERRSTKKMSKKKQNMMMIRDKASSCSIKKISSPDSNQDLLKSKKQRQFLQDYQETLPNYYQGEKLQFADDINFRIASDQTIHNSVSPKSSYNFYHNKSNTHQFNDILHQSSQNIQRSKFQSSSSLNQFLTNQKQSYNKEGQFSSVSPIKQEIALSRTVNNQSNKNYIPKNNKYQSENNKRHSLNQAQQHSRNAQLVRAQTTKSLLQVNSKQIQRNSNLFKKNRKPQQSLINSAIVSQQCKSLINRNHNSPQCISSYQQDHNRPASSATATFPQSLATFGTNKTLRALGAVSNDIIKSNIMTEKAVRNPSRFQQRYEQDDYDDKKQYRVPSYSQRDIGLMNAVSNSNTIPNSSSIPSSSNQSPFRLFQQKFNSRNSNRSSEFKNMLKQQQPSSQYFENNQSNRLQQDKLRVMKSEGMQSNAGSRDQSSLYITGSDGQYNTNRCQMSASSFGIFQIQPKYNDGKNMRNYQSNKDKNSNFYGHQQKQLQQQQQHYSNEIQTPNSFTSPNGFSTISPINAHSNQNSQNHQISASDQIYTSCFDQKNNRSGELRQSNHLSSNIFDQKTSFIPSILYSSIPNSEMKTRNHTNQKSKEQYLEEDYQYQRQFQGQQDDDVEYVESNRRCNKIIGANRQKKDLQMSPGLVMLANTQSSIQQSNSLGNSNPSSFLFQQQQHFNKRQSLSGLGITSTTMIGPNQSQNNDYMQCIQRESQYQLEQEDEEELSHDMQESRIIDGRQNVRDDDDDDNDDDDDDQQENQEDDLDQLLPESKQPLLLQQQSNEQDDYDYIDDDNVSEQIRFVLKDDIMSMGSKNFYSDNLALYKSDGFLVRANKQQDSRNEI